MAPAYVEIDPRVRIIGSLLGQSRSRRRGRSSDVVGARPYLPGDDVRLIDWAATARLTAAAGEERFIVREFYAEEAPTVVLAVDRSPTMRLYPPELPWLQKPAALRRCVEAVTESAARHQCLVSYVDSAADSLERPQPVDADRPRSWALSPCEEGADADWLFTSVFEERRWLPPGTLVFVFSDFVRPLGDRLLIEALDAEWELVPVVLSDPRWERSFPVEVGGMTLPMGDMAGRLRPVRLSSAEARARRDENERHHRELVARFTAAGWPPVVVSSSEEQAVTTAFLDWAARRATPVR